MDQRPHRAGLDALRLQFFNDRIAVKGRILHIQAEKPVVGAGAVLTEGQDAQTLDAVQLFHIVVVQRLFVGDKRFQPLQLGNAKARLHVGHTVVVADLIVEKLQQVGFCLGRKMLGVFRPVGVVGHDGTARAGGDDLVAVKAVAADIAHGAGKLTGKFAGGKAGTQRLGGVLNQNQMVLLRNLGQALHIAQIAENVYHLQRLDVGAGGFVVQLAVPQLAVSGTESLHRVGVDAKGIIAADKNRLCAHIAGQRVDGSNKSQRRYDHFIPAGDARRHRRQMQRTGTGVARYGAGHMYIVGKRLLKFGDLAAAGGHPPRGDGFPGKGSLTRAEIRNRKGNKLRHKKASYTRYARGRIYTYNHTSTLYSSCGNTARGKIPPPGRFYPLPNRAK